MLIDSALLNRLQRIKFRMRRDLLTTGAGAHQSHRKGDSVEFSGYRLYSPGDDLRHIDWKVYSRSDKYYVREFEGEARGQVMLVLDRSPSMFVPGAWNLSHFAATLALALSAAALSSGDVVSFEERFTGLKSLAALSERLEATTSEKSWDLGSYVTSRTASLALPAKLIIISDFLCDYLPTLDYLSKRNFDVVLIHLFKDLPVQAGSMDVVDSETGRVESLSFSAQNLALYRRKVSAHQLALTNEAKRRGFSYSYVSVDSKVEDVVFYQLRRDGVLR